MVPRFRQTQRRAMGTLKGANGNGVKKLLLYKELVA